MDSEPIFGMKNPTFSVVTPSLNQAEFIEETIRSVLGQVGDFYIDYVIMDGGSSDGSVEIIKKYDDLLRAKEWPVKCKGIKYSWVSQKDGGQADAIEKGFSATNGDIGVWLNSDDLFYSNDVFQKVAMHHASDNIDLLIGNGALIDKKGRFIRSYETNKIDEKELLFLDYHILQPSAFLKAEYYKNHIFDKNLCYCFDVEFFIRLILNGVRYKKVNDRFSCFRMYPEIKTITGLENRYEEFMVIGKRFSHDKFCLTVSSIYKYIAEVMRIKYENRFLFQKSFPLIRKFAYKLVVGTWGRKT